MPTSWLDLLRWTLSFATVSGVDRISPCRLANCLPIPLSSVDCPCPWFHANSLELLFPKLTLFRVPLPLPDTARSQVQKPFVWFRAKTDKGIVCLAGHLYSVTLITFSFPLFFLPALLNMTLQHNIMINVFRRNRICRNHFPLHLFPCFFPISPLKLFPFHMTKNLEWNLIHLTLNTFLLPATPLSSPSFYHVPHLLINRRIQKTVQFVNDLQN